MGQIDYGESGIEEIVVIDKSGSAGPKDYPLGELADNDNILNFERPLIQVKGPGKDAEVELVQKLGGRALPAGALKARKGHRFEVAKGLFRGRNDFVVTVGDGEPFEFSLYYRSFVLEWVESLLKALILVVVVKTFVVQAFFIPTGSMEKTLFPSDYILVEKVTGLFSRPKTGDVIVFQYPEDPTKDFIKRKVADAGDEIKMVRKRYFRNGECLDETGFAHNANPGYVPPFSTMNDYWRRDTIQPTTVPPAHSWAMGDNRDNSQDSRFWGALPDYRLKGRALAIYWPPKRIGAVRPETGAPAPPGDCP